MSHNTWIHRGVRAVLVKPLSRTPVTPNHLTTLRMVTALAAAACLAVGPEFWRYVGAVLFLLSGILDRADGELARLTGRSSPGGHLFDLVSDGVSNVAIFVGLGVGLRDGSFGTWAVVMGIAAGLAVGLSMWLVLRMEQTSDITTYDLGGFAGFDPDDALFLVPLALWLGWAEPLLVAALIGAPLFDLFFFLWLGRRRSIDLQSQQTPEAPQGVDHRPDGRGDE